MWSENREWQKSFSALCYFATTSNIQILRAYWVCFTTASLSFSVQTHQGKDKRLLEVWPLGNAKEQKCNRLLCQEEPETSKYSEALTGKSRWCLDDGLSIQTDANLVKRKGAKIMPNKNPVIAFHQFCMTLITDKQGCVYPTCPLTRHFKSWSKNIHRV